MDLEKLENINVVSPSEYDTESVEPIQECSTDSVELYEDTELFSTRLETTEFVTDLEVKENIANYLETVNELRYENWRNLSLEQRKEVLNKVEQNIAAIEHRPSLHVEVEKMKPRDFGYQSAKVHKIALNSLYVGYNDPKMHREVLDTIIHEGRHAYQHFNVDVKLIHESGSEVMTWRENFYEPKYQYYQSGMYQIYIPYPDGKRYDVDFRLYYYQPVEIDARNFASDVMSKLEEKGFVCAAKGDN